MYTQISILVPVFGRAHDLCFLFQEHRSLLTTGLPKVASKEGGEGDGGRAHICTCPPPPCRPSHLPASVLSREQTVLRAGEIAQQVQDTAQALCPTSQGDGNSLPALKVCSLLNGLLGVS